MKNKNMRTFWITTILCLVPIGIGLVLYDQLPDQIATHFNFEGEADGYMSKVLTIFGLPLFMAVINGATHFTLSTDPKNNEGQNTFMYNFGKWTCPILSMTLMPILYYMALGNSFNVRFFVMLLIGILFIVIGNYLPKCKQNYTIGIKLPWTLHSEQNWNLTHRFSGFVWVLGGILIIILNCISNVQVYTIGFFGILIVLTVVPFVYSYILYRKGI